MSEPTYTVHPYSDLLQNGQFYNFANSIRGASDIHVDTIVSNNDTISLDPFRDDLAAIRKGSNSGIDRLLNQILAHIERTPGFGNDQKNDMGTRYQHLWEYLQILEGELAEDADQEALLQIRTLMGEALIRKMRWFQADAYLRFVPSNMRPRSEAELDKDIPIHQNL
jgi:hypothetical protein|tara:strand:- start:907 stop:1407 length:501 start_codon:yes stop_codon:yes gene_type:complete